MDATSPAPPEASEARNPGVTDLRARVRASWDVLSPAERAVAAALSELSAERLLWATSANLAADTGRSNATVIRTLQRLGYAGLPGLKHAVGSAETTTMPEDRVRRRLHLTGESMERIVDAIWEEAHARLGETRDRADVVAIGEAAALLARSGQVHTYGVGSSSLAAAHLALRLIRSGRTARHLDADGLQLADHLLQLHTGDAVVVFAPGRLSTEVEAVVSRAREVGATTILITDSLGDELRDRVAVVLAAAHTPTGLTAEPLASVVLADVLVQAVARLAPETAVETSHTLSIIREHLGYERA